MELCQSSFLILCVCLPAAIIWSSFFSFKYGAQVGRRDSGFARIKKATAGWARESVGTHVETFRRTLTQDVAHWVAITGHTHSCERTFFKSSVHFATLREHCVRIADIYAKDNREISEFRFDYGRMESYCIIAIGYLCDMLESAVHEMAVVDLFRGKLDQSPRLHFFALNREIEDWMLVNGLPRSMELPFRFDPIPAFLRVSIALLAVVEHSFEAALQVEFFFQNYYAIMAV